MEALIVAFFALVAIVLLDAAYLMAVTLLRWALVLAIGAIISWLAAHHDASHAEALELGILASLVARRLMPSRTI